MPARLMHRRTLQVCLLLTVALLFSRVPQWEHGSWILISVGAIIGPFSPLLTFRKSMLRALGTTAGLLLSAMLIATLSHLPWSIPILGVILAYGIAFTSQQDYRYFIMIVTVAIALNFADMYVPFTPFEPWSFFSSRAMGVFIGIAVYVTLEWFVFGKQEFIRWAKANNDEFADKLATIVTKLNNLDASSPSLNQPLLAEISLAQAAHAESLSNMASDLDQSVFGQAKRLQRIAQRLQMSVYRALCGSTRSDLNITMRKRRIQALLSQQCA
ncbi:MAG TPA: FUSC family protein [Orrella sp.]